MPGSDCEEFSPDEQREWDRVEADRQSWRDWLDSDDEEDNRQDDDGQQEAGQDARQEAGQEVGQDEERSRKRSRSRELCPFSKSLCAGVQPRQATPHRVVFASEPPGGGDPASLSQVVEQQSPHRPDPACPPATWQWCSRCFCEEARKTLSAHLGGMDPKSEWQPAAEGTMPPSSLHGMGSSASKLSSKKGRADATFMGAH